MPKVSVCVPVYKVEEYIEKSAGSFFCQTLDDLEFIFVDDCSPDKSVERLEKVAKEYPHLKIKIIRLTNNSGPGIARKTAADASCGNYIYFPDADDWIEPTMLEELYNVAVKENADIVKCRSIFETKKGSTKSTTIYPSKQSEWFDAVVRRKTGINLITSLIKRDLYIKAIGDSEIRRMIRFEDYLVSVKLHYYSNNCILLDKYMYHINRLNINSITKTSNDLAVESCMIAASQLEDFLDRLGLKDDFTLAISELRQFGFDSYLYDTRIFNPEKWRGYYNKYGMTPMKSVDIKLYIKKLAISRHDKSAFALLKIYNIILRLVQYIKS